MTVESFEIATDFTSDQFRHLTLTIFPHDDWTKAVDVFKSRFNSRYFNPLTTLAGSSTQDGHIHGFIVLSCAFLLVETLGGFKCGAADHLRKSETLFVSGLEHLNIQDAHGDVAAANNDQKKKLYTNGRCALLHTAGTEKILHQDQRPCSQGYRKWI